MSFIKTLVCLFLAVISFNALSSYHFTEVYQEEGTWRVDHFKANPGELQERVGTHTFQYEYQAIAFANTIKQQNKSIQRFNFVSTEEGTAPLWKVTQEWNDEWEEKYSQWVEKNLDTEFFVRHQLATDCADVAYAIRWVFARDNGLPAAATLAGSGTIVTHLSAKSAWDKLPGHTEWSKDKRFLAALNWLLDSVYTKTLYLDAYPVKLSRETVRPGLINLLGGHTEIFNKASFIEGEVPLEVVSSTTPRQVRSLHGRIFMDHEVTDQQSGGLLQFRWPIVKSGRWSMIPKEKMPKYSMEQYDEDLCEKKHFTFCILDKLGLKFDPDRIVTKLTHSLDETLKARINIVEEGHRLCQRMDCSPGSVGYEDWSTPSRDGRLVGQYYSAMNTAQQLEKYEIFGEWENTFLEEGGLKFRKGDFFERLEMTLVSYDPRDTIGMRWALTVEDISQYVQKNFREVQKQRDVLIVKAASCRKEPAVCKNSIEKFKEFSTLELDKKSRFTVARYQNFCYWNECPESLIDESKIIFFQSPAPWDSVAKRTGAGINLKSLRFLPSSGARFAGKSYLLLENGRAYHIQSGELIQLSDIHTLTYLPDQRLIVGTGEDHLNFYDEEFKLIGRMEFPEVSEFSLNDIKGGYLFFSKYISEDDTGFYDYRLINVFTRSAVEKGRARNLEFDSDIVTMQLSGPRILYTEQGKLMEIVLDSSFQTAGAWRLTNKKFLFYLSKNGEDFKYYVWENGKLEKWETPYSSVHRYLGNYFISSLIDNNENFSSALLDSNLRIVLPKINESYSMTGNLSLIVTSDGNGKKVFKLSNQGLFPIKLKLTSLANVAYLNSDSVVNKTASGYQTYGFDGSVGAISKFSFRGDCSDSFGFSVCSSRKNLFDFEYNSYDDSSNSRSYFEISSKQDNFAVYAHGPTYGSGVEFGSLIPLSDGLSLWFED